MKKSKQFKDYAYQVIDNTKKKITYIDKRPTSSEVEVYPIDFRIKIDPVKHKGYIIKTK